MGIKFFALSYLDHTQNGVTLSVTDSVAFDTGGDFINEIRNRSDKDGWMTSGSNDAANTELLVTFSDLTEFTRILLLNHNFKNFTMQYYDEDTNAWADFSTPIAVTNFAGKSSYFEVERVFTFKVKLTIQGTQTPNADKSLRQFLICEEIGELVTELNIDPVFDDDRKISKYVSGRNYVTKSIGGIKIKLTMSSIGRADDLELIEYLHSLYGGFHTWLCGGDITQYETVRNAYRMEDIFYTLVSTLYNPQWRDGRYYNGMIINFTLVEVN